MATGGKDAQQHYAVALGSNQPLARGRKPPQIIVEAIARLDSQPLAVTAVSPVMDSPPLGPSRRRFANAAVLLSTTLDPLALLRHLKRMEQRFERRRGQRWGPRTLDLDIILWSGGGRDTRGLTIPHPGFRIRAFVLKPLVEIAPSWREPRSGLTVRHLAARLDRRKPVDRMGRRL